MYFIDLRTRTGTHRHHTTPIQHYFMSSPLQLSSSRGPVSRAGGIWPPNREFRKMCDFTSDDSVLGEHFRWFKEGVRGIIVLNKQSLYHQTLVKMHPGCLLLPTQTLPGTLECPMDPNWFARKKNPSGSISDSSKKNVSIYINIILTRILNYIIYINIILEESFLRISWDLSYFISKIGLAPQALQFLSFQHSNIGFSIENHHF